MPVWKQNRNANVLLYSICIKTLKSVCQPGFQCFRLTNIFVKWLLPLGVKEKVVLLLIDLSVPKCVKLETDSCTSWELSWNWFMQALNVALDFGKILINKAICCPFENKIEMIMFY